MRPHGAARLLAALAAAGACLAPVQTLAAAALPGGRLLPGNWLSVEGSFSGEGVLRARQVEPSDERRPTLKGPLDAYDPETGALRFGSIQLSVDEGTRLEDDSGQTLSLSDLRPGMRVKIVLDAEARGARRVRRLRRLASDSSIRRIEGPVETLAQDPTRTSFRLLGIEVQADAKTRWVGIVGPFSTVDDEDVRFGSGIPLGKMGRLDGEVRYDYRARDNYDLSDQLDRDVTTRRYWTELDFTLPSTLHLSAMAGVKAYNEGAIVDQADTFDNSQKFLLAPTYLLLSGVLSRHGSLQIGRARFDDERDWLFRRDLDALRVLFDFDRVHLEASASQEIVTPEDDSQKDILNSLLFFSLYPGGGNALSAYVFDRSDHFRLPDGTQRDFSPRYYGLRAYGEGTKTWSYWLEAALALGSLAGQPLRGKALDAGGSLTLPIAWKPTLTVGYAYGSGDDDPADGVNHAFRQTGLELNNGKWNGVTNFRYYGEVLRPELTNLHIQTYGLGIRPHKKTSFDCVYHRYDLDRPASKLVGASIKDRRLNLIDRDVGREWDLVIGFEEIEHLEFEVDLGLFLAGKAFLGDVDPARLLALKVKYIF